MSALETMLKSGSWENDGDSSIIFVGDYLDLKLARQEWDALQRRAETNERQRDELRAQYEVLRGLIDRLQHELAALRAAVEAAREVVYAFSLGNFSEVQERQRKALDALAEQLEGLK